MSTHTDEVIYLLDRAAALDAAVHALTTALEAPSQAPRCGLKGIVYKSLSDRLGFTVTLHGVTLHSVYEQVLDRSASCPDLFGRIHLCLAGDGGKLGDVVISLLIADTGDYSDDGTTHWAYSTYDETGRPSDPNRYRLSLAIARAVQAALPVLPLIATITSSSEAASHPAHAEAPHLA